MYSMRRLTATLAAFAACSLVHATPYVPKDGKQVLETLPNRYDPVQQAFSRMRAKLARNP